MSGEISGGIFWLIGHHVGMSEVTEMARLVKSRLTAIERDEGVTVLYACESGSRAWGFASEDSDWDVRFVYVRPRDWYLSIDLERKRDVIEFDLDENDLDIAGWDLRKALQLFAKANPPLLEWLDSGIVYREVGWVAARLRELAPRWYSPLGCLYHYRSMATRTFKDKLDRDVVKRKSYLYAIRPLLAARWIEAGHGPAPMDMMRALETATHDDPVRDAIEKLVEEKRAGGEQGVGPRDTVLHDFIAGELERLESKDLDVPVGRDGVFEELNELFRAVLGEEKGISRRAQRRGDAEEGRNA